jgi:TDG/mug DNA glycosylase family protein
MTEKEKPMHQVHNIEPVYDAHSRVLILGSFPSVKSREAQFFYGHKQNRFWKVLSGILECPVPETIPEKKEMLLSHHIAVWDVIGSCTITGSSDSSIRDVVPNDISRILNHADIRLICANGNKSWELYRKYLYPQTRREAVKLPSTSPANAAFRLDDLIEEWNIIKKEIANS